MRCTCSLTPVQVRKFGSRRAGELSQSGPRRVERIATETTCSVSGVIDDRYRSSLAPFRHEAPRPLFEAKGVRYLSTDFTRSWDVSADGQQFLMLRYEASTDKPVTAMHVVQNWTEELKRLVPTK